MNPQFDFLGSQRKPSVSILKSWEKPNLDFKAPTYKLRDSRLLSTRQGGLFFAVAEELLLFFMVLTVELNRARIKIDTTNRFYSPIHDMFTFCIFFKTLPITADLNGAYPIDLKYLYKFIFPPE